MPLSEIVFARPCAAVCQAKKFGYAGPGEGMRTHFAGPASALWEPRSSWRRQRKNTRKNMTLTALACARREGSYSESLYDVGETESSVDERTRCGTSTSLLATVAISLESAFEARRFYEPGQRELDTVTRGSGQKDQHFGSWDRWS